MAQEISLNEVYFNLFQSVAFVLVAVKRELCLTLLTLVNNQLLVHKTSLCMKWKGKLPGDIYSSTVQDNKCFLLHRVYSMAGQTQCLVDLLFPVVPFSLCQ